MGVSFTGGVMPPPPPPPPPPCSPAAVPGGGGSPQRARFVAGAGEEGVQARPEGAVGAGVGVGGAGSVVLPAEVDDDAGAEDDSAGVGG